MNIEHRMAVQKQRRRYRVRNRIRRSAYLRPRLNVFRSQKHIYAQIIDDQLGTTLVAASSLDGAIAGPGKCGGNKDAATKVGQLLAQRAAEKGIQKVAFDRGVYKYHGRVAALADAAREGGLEF